MASEGGRLQGGLGVDVVAGASSVCLFRPVRQPAARARANPYGEVLPFRHPATRWQRAFGFAKATASKVTSTILSLHGQPNESAAGAQEPWMAPLSPARPFRSDLVAPTPLSPLGCGFTPEPRRQVCALLPCGSPLRLGSALAIVEPPVELAQSGTGKENAECSEGNSLAHDARDTSQDFWRAQLDAIYCRRNPHKREQLDEFLEKYKGREVILYRKVCEKYDLCPTKFYADPKAWTGLEGETLEDCVDLGGASTQKAVLPNGGGFAGMIESLMNKVSCRRSAVSCLKDQVFASCGGECEETKSGNRRTTLLLGSGRKSWSRRMPGADLFSADSAGSIASGVGVGEVPSARTIAGDAIASLSVHSLATNFDALAQRQLAPRPSSNSSSQGRPFGFKFALGSVVFGSLTAKQAPSIVESPDSNLDSMEAECLGPESDAPRRACPAVIAQRRFMKAKRRTQPFPKQFMATSSSQLPVSPPRPLPRITSPHQPPAIPSMHLRAAIASASFSADGDLRRPTVAERCQSIEATLAHAAKTRQTNSEHQNHEDLGLTTRVRADLKRKLERFESNPGLPKERSFSSNKAQRCDSVPSPARIGFMRETFQRRRQ